MPCNKLKLFWLPGLAGILGLLSFPKANLGYLAWLALVPMVSFVYLDRSVAHAFWGGFVAGAVQFFFLLIWIPPVLTHYGGMPSAFAWFLYSLMIALLACFPGSACSFTRFCVNRCGEKYLLTLPLAWASMEYLRNYLFFGGFPWLQIGYSQTDYLVLVQVADLTGVYGVSFLILWVNTALAWAGLRRLRKWDALTPLLLGAMMVAVCILYGQQALRRWGNQTPDLNAALLQCNLSPEDSEKDLTWKSQSGYAKLADQLGARKIDLLVLPESPSPLTFQYDSEYRETLLGLSRRFSLGLIFNNVTYAGTAVDPIYFNSAYFLSGKGQELGRYDKIHLVPFGEYIPWKKIFFFAETISKDVGNFDPGTEYRTVRMGAHPVNAIICFEAIFPELVREFIREGSQLIVNLTNDGWYGDSAAPYQHLAMARWRAVENRRFLLRATNSGISSVIEPTGWIQARTGLMREEICVGRFAFVEEQSFYTRWGDLFAKVCGIILVCILAYCQWRGATV